MAGETRFSVDPTEFAEKLVLVTGGTKGMGEAIVRRLQASGASVATTARSPLPHAKRPTCLSRPISERPRACSR